MLLFSIFYPPPPKRTYITLMVASTSYLWLTDAILSEFLSGPYSDHVPRTDVNLLWQSLGYITLGITFSMIMVPIISKMHNLEEISSRLIKGGIYGAILAFIMYLTAFFFLLANYDVPSLGPELTELAIRVAQFGVLGMICTELYNRLNPKIASGSN